jgi:hypothetical protein
MQTLATSTRCLIARLLLDLATVPFKKWYEGIGLKRGWVSIFWDTHRYILSITIGNALSLTNTVVVLPSPAPSTTLCEANSIGGRLSVNDKM